VNNSVDGDTILVNRGVYVENVVVDKKLEIISMSGNLEDTSVQTLNPGDHVFHVTANSVTIKGFGLRSASSRSGIYLDNVQHNIIANSNTQYGFERSGIYLDNVQHNIIANSNTQYGFELAASNNNTLKGNIGNSDTNNLSDNSSNYTDDNEIKSQDINREIENKSFIGALISAVVSRI